MDPETHVLFVYALVAGCIRGMAQARNELEESRPGTFPQVDDSHMFDAAGLLMASLLVANPAYRDPASDDAALALASGYVGDQLAEVRRQGVALGRPVLCAHIDAAIDDAPLPLATDHG